MNRSILHSLREFCVRTFKHWGLFVSGAAASILGWMLYAVNVQNIPSAAFVVTGTALLLAAMVRAFHDVRLERDEMGERDVPKLEILFLPDNDRDSRPYLQRLVFGIHQSPGEPMIEMMDRRFRIGIRNLSSALVPNVSAKLVRCEPGGNFVFPEHELAVQDTDPPAGSCDIPPHLTKWFDVTNEMGPTGRIPDHFRFCYRNPHFSQLPIPPGRYEILIRVEGGGTSCEKMFRIEKLSGRGDLIRLNMMLV